MTHTPGPWTVVRQGYCWRVEHNVPGKRYHVVSRTPDGTTPENEANARLMGAAPDLLAACRQAEARLTKMIDADDLDDDRQHPLNELRRTLMAAIAKTV